MAAGACTSAPGVCAEACTCASASRVPWGRCCLSVGPGAAVGRRSGCVALHVAGQGVLGSGLRAQAAEVAAWESACGDVLVWLAWAERLRAAWKGFSLFRLYRCMALSLALMAVAVCAGVAKKQDCCTRCSRQAASFAMARFIYIRSRLNAGEQVLT